MSMTDKKEKMYDACQSDKNISLVKQLLDEGFPVDKTIKDRFFNAQRTPLQIACSRGSKEIASLLISRGAKVNKADNFRFTPLHYACLHGYESIASLLISQGAMVNKASNAGWTPLFAACYKGHKSIASLLISQDAKVNKADSAESTPLHAACYGGYESIASLLISQGAMVNKANNAGFTALHAACYGGYVSIVRELLMNGADLNAAETGTSSSPMKIACQRGQGEVVLEILEFASKIQSRDSFRLMLENARKWFVESGRGRGSLSTVLSEDVMDSLEYNLSINIENNEKGAR